MKFPYSQVYDYSQSRPQVRVLPWLPIEISPKKSFKDSLMPLGLVDSGADTSIITRKIGEDLGIDIENGIGTAVRGVGGAKIEGYIHTIHHRINSLIKKQKSIMFKGEVIFTKYEFPETMPQSTALWGRNCVFKETIITFDDPNSFEIFR